MLIPVSDSVFSRGGDVGGIDILHLILLNFTFLYFNKSSNIDEILIKHYI